MSIWILATLAAFFLKGLCGFANTLVFSTIVGFTSSNLEISPLELILSFPSNLIMAIKERRSIRWRISLPLILLVMAGSIPGAFVLKNSGAGLVKLIFGGVIVLAGVSMLLKEFGVLKKTAPAKWELLLIGSVSGVLCGLYGIGVLVAVCINRMTEDPHIVKGNVCVIFMSSGIFRMILYAVCGVFTWPILKQSLMLLPFMLIGLIAGMLFSDRIHAKKLKKCVCIVLILSGIVLLLKNLVG